jgi:RNase P/RNase MRP subunit p29
MKINTKSEFDLIGHDVTITSSKNEGNLGINGKIIMETKNMIILNTKDGKKSIPKNVCKLSNNDGSIETDSTKLSKRPHERLEILI